MDVFYRAFENGLVNVCIELLLDRLKSFQNEK